MGLVNVDLWCFLGMRENAAGGYEEVQVEATRVYRGLMGCQSKVTLPPIVLVAISEVLRNGSRLPHHRHKYEQDISMLKDCCS